VKPESSPEQEKSLPFLPLVLMAAALLLSSPGKTPAYTLDPENIRVVSDPADPLKTVFDSYVPESFIPFEPGNFRMVRRFDDTLLVVPKRHDARDAGNIVYIVLSEGRKASEASKVTLREHRVGNDPYLSNVEEVEVLDRKGKSIPLTGVTSSFVCKIDEETDSRMIEYRCIDVRFEGDGVLNRHLLIRFVKFGLPKIGECDGQDPRTLIKYIDVPGKTRVCGYVVRGGIVADPEAAREADGQESPPQGGDGFPGMPEVPQLPPLPNMPPPPPGMR